MTPAPITPIVLTDMNVPLLLVIAGGAAFAEVFMMRNLHPATELDQCLCESSSGAQSTFCAKSSIAPEVKTFTYAL
jgi:hypothetical protein